MVILVMVFRYLAGPFDETECRKQGCLYEPTTIGGTPFCILNPAVHGYSLDGTVQANDKGFEASLNIKPQTKTLAWHKDHVDKLKLTTQYLTNKIVRIKLTDPSKSRYEVPTQKYFNLPAQPQGTKETAIYDVELGGGDFNLTIRRKGTKTKL